MVERMVAEAQIQQHGVLLDDMADIANNVYSTEQNKGAYDRYEASSFKNL